MRRPPFSISLGQQILTQIKPFVTAERVRSVLIIHGVAKEQIRFKENYVYHGKLLEEEQNHTLLKVMMIMLVEIRIVMVLIGVTQAMVRQIIGANVQHIRKFIHCVKCVLWEHSPGPLML